MRALVVSSFGGPEALRIVDIERPTPGPAQVRVAVAASSVHPIDVSTREGRLTHGGLMGPRNLVGLGWDVAGTVDAVGAEVTRFSTGDAVIGLRDLLTQVPGAQAEYVVLHESALALAPRTVDLREAATLPLLGLTADGALSSACVSWGDTVLVTGAAGGVGALVVQLARLRGLRTIAVGAEHDEDFLRSLGARDVVHRGGDVPSVVRSIAPHGVDAVIDAAVLGAEAHEALRPGGTFVALVRPFAPPPIRGTRVVVWETWADGPRLAETGVARRPWRAQAPRRFGVPAG